MSVLLKAYQKTGLTHSSRKYKYSNIHNCCKPCRRQEVNDTDQRGLVILPYAKSFSERITKVLRSFNIKVAHKPIHSIPNILKKPKDKIEKEDSKGVIYKIKCRDCDSVYKLWSDITCTKNTRKRTF